MPELPEVETIRLGLQKYLVGHTIENVDVRLSKIVQGDPSKIKGAKVKGVRRFGKGLVIDLKNGYSIAIHIKLTGQLIYHDPKTKNPPKVKVIKDIYNSLPNKWTHVIFHLDKGAKLYYNDFRQFGWIKIVPNTELSKLVFFKELGPEPFKDLTFSKFFKILQAANSLVKVVLMDQKKISGIGNIYANDALNLAKIDPKRKAKSLSHIEAQKLYGSILEVLKKGLAAGGASELSFVNVLGEEGGYQNHFVAYGREGKPCKNCKTPLKKIKLAGRGTYFCENCQK